MAEGRVCWALWQVERAVQRRMDEALAPLGLTISQWGALGHLVKGGPLSAADLARATGVTPQSAAAGLAELLRVGLVTRAPHPGHGRVVLHEATPAGEARWREAEAHVEAVEQQVLAGLGEGGRERFRADLAAVAEAVGAPLPAAAVPLWPVPAARG